MKQLTKTQLEYALEHCLRLGKLFKSKSRYQRMGIYRAPL